MLFRDVHCRIQIYVVLVPATLAVKRFAITVFRVYRPASRTTLAGMLCRHYYELSTSPFYVVAQLPLAEYPMSK